MPSAGARTAWPTAEEMSIGVVRARLAGERIGAAAEAVGQDAANRRDRRRRGEELRLRDELLLEDREIALDAVRAERHLVDVIAIRVVAEVGRAKAADAALGAVIEAADAGVDGQFAGAVFNGVELAAERLDRLAELFVGGLELFVFVAELAQLVGLREGGEVLDGEEGRQAEGRGDDRDEGEEQAVGHLQLPELGPRVRDKDDC